MASSLGFTIPKRKLEALDLNYGDLIEIEIFKEYQGYPSITITRSLRKVGYSLRINLKHRLVNALNLKAGDGIQIDIRKYEEEVLSEKSTIRQLFDELTHLFIRLYKSKASSSLVFARTIHNSFEMQKYFGIEAKGISSPGKDLDDFEIYIIDKLFKIIPNSAHLSLDDERNGNFGFLLNKDSDADTIKYTLRKFFNQIAKFVSREFNITLEFREDINI